MALNITKENGVWAFDDEARGLKREPFVAGADILCDVLAQSVGSKNEVAILFSANEFPGADIILDWVREECGGNVYEVKSISHICWLCPALLRFFSKAPKKIYVQAKKG